MLRRQSITIGSLAAASLLLESTLTRLLAVSQYYHFAFLVVSLALLGYGASGSILYVATRKKRFTEKSLIQFISWLGLVFAVSVALAYAIINYLPFDSYSIAWDRRQILYFGLFYVVLAIPFLISGLATGAALSTIDDKKHLIYASNLLGSGIGALVAPFVLQWTGVPGGVLLSALMGIIAALLLQNTEKIVQKRLRLGYICFLIAGIFSLGYLTWMNQKGNSALGMVLSPYKGLAQALRVPAAEHIYGRWSAVSRVDVLKDAGTHRLPGLSYQYQGIVPQQLGLSVDAGPLQPITLAAPKDFEAASYLPEALVFELIKDSNILVIEPGGGLGVLQALSGGAKDVTVIVGNPLNAEAVKSSVGDEGIYEHDMVNMVFETARPFFGQSMTEYDIIFFPLVDAYRPVASGAFSLSESFDMTIEAYHTTISHLAPGGILVVTRWLQTPPSESARVFASLVEAMIEVGNQNVKETFIAYRGIQTMTTLLKPIGWEEGELEQVRSFAANRKYDLVWMPDILPEEVNRFNKLPEPLYFQVVKDILNQTNLEEVYNSYPFDITPPTDNHPFYYHFFKWGQTGDIIATMGHTWQPFGGSGFLVLFALLGLVLIISLVLIFVPLLLSKVPLIKDAAAHSSWRYGSIFGYFMFLGFAFLFIEIPLIQKAILLFGHPIYAFTTVVFSLLFFSGLGSAAARLAYLPPRLIMGLCPIMALLIPIVFTQIIEFSLGWSLLTRAFVVVVSLSPLAFLMGFPFPLGLVSVERASEGAIPWVWAVNGSVSVAASVLAAILILTFGFSLVLFLGAGMYAGASIIYFVNYQDSK